MRTATIDRDRGRRIEQAMTARGRNKALALAVEMGISPAALTKWKQGGAISLANACHLAEVLDVSLDWLLLGRNAPAWLQADHLSAAETELIDGLRHRPTPVLRLVIALLAAIPEAPAATSHAHIHASATSATSARVG